MPSALMAALADNAPSPKDVGWIMLSKRETECLTWIAKGKTAWEVAKILAISESTIIFHIENAKAKLGAVTVTHAVAIAISRGMITINDDKKSAVGTEKN